MVGSPVCAQDQAPVSSSALKRRAPETPTACLVFADGTVLYGQGLGARGHAVGELCFNTAMTGYQEILTDASYAGQIVVFTFPHIGNVGANDEDAETTTPVARGCVLRAPVTPPSNYRSQEPFDAWLLARGIVGIAGVDTRALTRRLRVDGAANAVIAHAADGVFDFDTLSQEAAAWPGLEGMDLARAVTAAAQAPWREARWDPETGYAQAADTTRHIVAIDYGVKRNMLRELADLGCRVTVVPAETSADEILALQPDGVLLSNGPGDPDATGAHALPTIRALLDADMPMLGICLGHQMLALALGAKTEKMHQGHHGANHPVQNLATGKVEITSMNHGFTVASASLPETVRATHVSLFDGSNCGLEVIGKPVFSVQYHPEASPGPQDSQILFRSFVEKVDAAGPVGAKA